MEKLVGISIDLRIAKSLNEAIRISPSLWDETINKMRRGIENSKYKIKHEVEITSKDGQTSVHAFEYLKHFCCY